MAGARVLSLQTGSPGVPAWRGGQVRTATARAPRRGPVTPGPTDFEG